MRKWEHLLTFDGWSPVLEVGRAVAQSHQGATLSGNSETIESCPAPPALLSCCGIEACASLHSVQEVDADIERHSHLTVGVAGSREGNVRQREDDATVKQVHEIQHVLTHGYRGLAVPLTQLQELNAQKAREGVLDDPLSNLL